MTDQSNFLGLNLSGRARLPVIRQNEAAECGLASLAMVAGYYGHSTDLSTLRRKYMTSLQGMTLRSVMEVANRLGLTSRPVKLPLSHVGQLRLPAILHWNMNHFVVLKSVAKNKFTLHDPSLGERSYTAAEFSKHFTGVALELTPTEKFVRREAKTTLRLSDLWGRMFGLKRNLLQVLALSVVLQLFVLASPFYLQIAVDEVLASFDTELLLVLALGFGGLTLINVLAQTLRGYVLLYFGSMLSYQMVGNLFRHLLHLPVDYFEKRHIGDIVSRFGSATPIKDMLTEGLIASVIDGAMALTTLTLMFVYSPVLATIALAAWTLYFALRMAFYKPFRARQEDVIVAHAKEQTTFMESVRGITSLKLFGGENDRQRFWQNHFADSINEDARFQKLSIWFESARTGIFGIELIVLVYVAVHLVLDSSFTVGMIFAFMAYKRNFTDKASALVERTIEFRLLGLHLERLADIVHTQEETQPNDQSGLSDVKPITGLIEVEKLSYRYAADATDVLNNISVKIEPGTSVAIIGASGCGKTTLLKIMTGLFQPSQGRVLIDGTPLTTYGLAAFRKQIGVVMQQDDLFAGSIAENISFFDAETDMAQVIAVAQAARIHDEILAMPMNYESLVGDMGSTLSGGQRQRLMLARALYRKPKILFMDEGTAHLDVATEHMVNESIAQLGITRIVIAHRPETIRMSDRVLEMRAESICEVDMRSHPYLNRTNDTVDHTTFPSFSPAEVAASAGKKAGANDGAQHKSGADGSTTPNQPLSSQTTKGS
ncbi:peptidase domain-containing ABC transporter [uncultured Tateyamaria sp.]|uniref:peptidase domain-containing ABC transporter n=1 Tax=uncultured Tateyamaria sp. TaxID=455651 RepID=UPI00262DFDF7|nr:peptidase domain-containing ABC transporter [uncultured Tateyamaria sp.]